jgi:NAD dependent epimerase/dehydratase family enzyme
MVNKKIVIAGGTGFIGQAMARYFGKDNHVVILSRQAVNGQNNNYSKRLLKASDGYNITYWRWDGKHVEKHWMNDMEGCDIVINLAGKSVNCRYNDRNKKEVLSSRIDATQTIGQAIRRTGTPPRLWINASSATIYRHAMDRAQEEENGEISDLKNDNMPFSLLDRLRYRWKKAKAKWLYGKGAEQYQLLDKDFSVGICKQWEQSFFEEHTPATRKVALRAAITLGAGGVMIPYFNLLKSGLGGYQGNGQQMYSWIHEDDLCRVVEWCYEHPEAAGVYNCAAPNPVTNTDFMRTLRKVTGHKFGLPAFTWMLELGAALIGTETELILKSRWVLPGRLLRSGFQFKYLQPENALQDIVNKTPRRRYHLF